MDYDDEVEQAEDSAAAAGGEGEAKKGSYAAIHATGFKDFMLKTEILRAVTGAGFEHPSEVQQGCIPKAVLGGDIICQAKSGMGKTAVFVLSLLHQIEAQPGTISAVVMCHTRELAVQIKNEFDRFAKYLPDIKCAVFYGGTSVQEHRALLKGPESPNIVVGTPGRVWQLVSEGTMDLSKVRHFILDEADKMLEQQDMRKVVQQIFLKTPHDKQTMLFSATIGDDIKPIARKFTQDAYELFVDNDAKLTLHGLQQYVVRLDENQKNRKLNDLLDALDFNQVIIFVGSVRRAIELNKLLNECNFPSTCSHSGLKQAERNAVLKAFKNFEYRILVSTDLMGRGIDIERVNVVICYDFSPSADQHLHRVNRAGRFGTKGLAISFISTPAEEEVLAEVQKRFSVKIEDMPDQIDSSTYMVA